MVSCFAPGCKSGHGGKKCHTFRPSSNTAKEWIRILWKLRSDKKFDPLIRSHRLCSLHFTENEIVKSDKCIIQGKEVHLDRIHWKLKDNVLPTFFPNIPERLQPVNITTRRQIKRQSSTKSTRIIKRQRKLTSEEKAPLGNDLQITSVEECLSKPTDWDDWNVLHGQWVFDGKSSALYGTENMFKCSKISRDTGEWTVAISGTIANHNIFKLDSRFPKQLKSIEDLRALSKLTDLVYTCSGMVGYQNVDKCPTAVRIDKVWFSEHCEHLCESPICRNCKFLLPVLRNRLYRNGKTSCVTSKSKPTTSYYRRRIKFFKHLQKTSRTELRLLRKKLNAVELSTVQNLISKTDLPESMKLSILQSLKLAAAKSGKGMRYAFNWLLECLLLKIKSPAAYHHLREAKILPLPHPNTLRRMISGQKCDFGFSETSLQAIKQRFQQLERRDRQGVLIFDEVQLRETIDFNKKTMKFTGYIDYAEFSGELIPEPESSKLANHALVMMYRPFNDSWCQPVAVFATRNAAKGTAIHKLVLAVIGKLEECRAEVLCIVCDGSKPNKSFWKAMGITGYTKETVNKIPHPYDEARFLYFASDVPHLFKCIRNHFRKYTTIQFDGDKIDFGFYEKLLNMDKARLPGLRKCPKLSSSHVFPNNFEKMVVSLATQLFSRSVATGLQFYRDLEYPDFKYSESTEGFTMKLNIIFDIMNARYPSQAITPDSSKFSELSRFNDQLTQEIQTVTDNSAQLLASRETLAALRVTITSTLDIIKFLVVELGFSYVLTAKMNQDCLEKFFGLIRAAGGREDHPTVSNFIQLYRLLNIYSPVKRVLRGNICEEENVQLLCEFEYHFKETRKCSEAETKAHRERHSCALMDRLIGMEECDFLNLEPWKSDINASDADKSIVYYLAGFLVHKAKKIFPCEDCLKSLQSDSPVVSELSSLVRVMDLGKLNYASERFFDLLFYGVELKLSKLLKNVQLYGDIILECIRGLTDVDISLIGCSASGHKYELLTALIPYYITLRLHFYARSVKKDIGRGKATKSKRKESKLVSC